MSPFSFLENTSPITRGDYLGWEICIQAPALHRFRPRNETEGRQRAFLALRASYASFERGVPTVLESSQPCRDTPAEIAGGAPCSIETTKRLGPDRLVEIGAYRLQLSEGVS